MDKKLPNEKILQMIRDLESGKLPQAQDLPEHVKEMIRNAEATGAKVMAVTADQFAALGGDVGGLLAGGLMLSVNANRDTKDPRYALGNKYAKELSDREFELMRIIGGEPAVARDAIRLQALMFANVDEIMEIAKEKQADSPLSQQVVLSTLAMLKTVGIANLYDALAAGPQRLRWHGMPGRALDVIRQMANNVPLAISKRLDLPMSAVRIITDEMAKVVPLEPLPAEKVFDPDLNSAFMRNLSPEHNEALDALVAAGFATLGDLFNKTQGFVELEEKYGISPEHTLKLGYILEKIDSVSIEAIDSVMALMPEDPEEKAEREREAATQPVITLTDPVVIAGLGINLTTTLEIAGIVDLHEVTGLRPTEAGTAIREALGEESIEAIKNVVRFKSTGCDCAACRDFKQRYVEDNPAIKEALRFPAQKPTLH